jgi:hypothetical protein
LPFELYDRRSAPIRTSPFVTLQRRGPMSLNMAAYELLGKPEAAALLFDRENQLIGIRNVPPTEPYAFPVRPQGRKGEKPSNYVMSTQAFTKYYGIDTSIAMRYPVEMQDDIMVIDLGRGVEATGPRDKSRWAGEGAQ